MVITTTKNILVVLHIVNTARFLASVYLNVLWSCSVFLHLQHVEVNCSRGWLLERKTDFFFSVTFLTCNWQDNQNSRSRTWGKMWKKVWNNQWLLDNLPAPSLEFLSVLWCVRYFFAFLGGKQVLCVNAVQANISPHGHMVSWIMLKRDTMKHRNACWRYWVGTGHREDIIATFSTNLFRSKSMWDMCFYEKSWQHFSPYDSSLYF